MKRTHDQDLHIDFWPGFTDALLAVVLVLIFVVTIFVVTQTGLVNILGSKERAMARLSQQLAQLEKDLNLSETRSMLLKGQVEGALSLLQETRAAFSEEVERTRSNLNLTQSSLEQTSADLSATLAELQSAQKERQEKTQRLEASSAQIQLLSERVQAYLDQVKILNAQLTSAKEELASKQASLGDLNQAVQALNDRVARLSAQLEEAKAEATSRRLELTKLIGEIEKRDQEISRLRRFEQYRSEFLARLAEIFEGLEDIKVTGDRFVFEGEVLFDSGKADLRSDGKRLLDRFFTIYKSLEDKIPADIGFNVQIQGHTDTDPIATAQFPSNWELSTARATEVVRYLVSLGVPSSRLSAAGFSEYYPAVPGSSEAAKRQNRRIEILFTRR